MKTLQLWKVGLVALALPAAALAVDKWVLVLAGAQGQTTNLDVNLVRDKTDALIIGAPKLDNITVNASNSTDCGKDEAGGVDSNYPTGAYTNKLRALHTAETGKGGALIAMKGIYGSTTLPDPGTKVDITLDPNGGTATAPEPCDVVLGGTTTKAYKVKYTYTE